MTEETLESPVGNGETVSASAEIAEDMENQEVKADGLGSIAADANDDNVSIGSSEISRMEMDMNIEQHSIKRPGSINLVPSESVFVKDRLVNDKFAKASGLYVRGLESRVRTLESQIRDIQLQTGLRKKEEEEDEAKYVRSSSV